MKTGTNEKLLHQLAMKVESISDPLEKQVVLMFDEMSIRMFLQYDQKNDRIEGIQDLGSQGRNSSPAKQALVFMIREQTLEDSYESGGMEDDSTTTASVNSVVDKHPTLESCSVRYVAGYLAYKIEQKFHCKLCKNTLTKCDANMESGHDYLIFHRAYLNKGQDDLGNLKSPTDMFTHITDLVLETFIEQFPDV
uniref:Transposable element P transposase-like RNase H domain-containing protein n=1 Tax=Timema genevievae TaxID=629358 RepID=A0A7R9KA68_TIMGE|nr:unnamed protein product [Timema genevievae]